MYATKINEQVINLAVSGKLWKRSLVMVDEETKTLWSQLLAKGMQGKLKETELEILPSVITDWATWKQNHPETTVLRLSRTANRFDRKFYGKPERFVIGIANPTAAKAWSFDKLTQSPVVNDSFANKPIVVFFQQETGAACVYSRTVGGEDLDFEFSDSHFKDQPTNSTWNFLSGECESGEHKGKRLMKVPAIPSFAKSWKIFYPHSEYWSPK